MKSIANLLEDYLNKNPLARETLVARQSLKQFVALVEEEKKKDDEAAKQRTEKFMKEAEEAMPKEETPKVDDEMEIRDLPF